MEDALAVLDAARTKEAHLVGNSLGATVARGIALFNPERVLSLTLVGPGFPVEGVPAETVEKMRASRAARESGDIDAAVTIARQEWIEGAEQEALLRELIARQARQATSARPVPEGFNDVERIAAPVMVVLGERDSQAVMLGAQELVRRIPRARLEVMEGAKHHPQEDRPEEFAQILAGFIAGRS